MKKLLTLILFVAITLVSCNKENAKTDSPVKSGKYSDLMDQFAYVYGFNLGNKFKQDSIKLNLEIFLEGIKEGFLRDSSQVFTKAEFDSVFMKFNEKMMMKQENQKKSEAETSTKFIEENKKKPGVKITESGLQYIVNKEGEGRNPKDEDFIKFKITGSLVNGKSLDAGQPVVPQTAPMTAIKTLPGLYEAFKMMKPGASMKIFCPPNLAYGDRGFPERGIAPNSVVIFDVEFISFEKKPEGMQQMPGGQPGQPNQPGQPQVKIEKAPKGN